MTPNRRRIAALALVFAVVATACAGNGGDNDVATDDATTTTGEVSEVQGAAAIEVLDEYLSDADDVPAPASDAAVPPGEVTEAGGAPGFSRYVFRRYEDQIIPSLVEGPLGEQTRCDDPDLPCSYLELKELRESGDQIPAELNMTEDELGALVDELDTLNATIKDYSDVNLACANGYRSDQTQTPNMGSHFYNIAAISDGKADPAFPDILLYTRAGDVDPGGPLGQCENGVWNGDPLKIVGTSYLLSQGQVGDEHPEGFTGPLDNWHIHYNLCRGSGSDTIVPQEACEEAGGRFSPTLGWMIHAWAADDYDNQLGVFSMWNPTIWPLTDPEAISEDFQVTPADLPEDASFSDIRNFDFGDPIEIKAGDTIVFGNSDSVPHTVTAGDSPVPNGGFDTGVFAPGTTASVTFDEPGEYTYFCVLHPDMVNTVTVTG